MRVEREGPVAVLVVDRPAARNALAPETMVALAAAVRSLAATDDVRALVLCGGGGHFLSGGDLRALAQLTRFDDGAALARDMRAVLDELAALPFPVIAAIDAFALGGGAEVAVAADLRVAAADAVIAFRHADMALITAWGGARRLAALVGRSRALRLLWTGVELDAREALQIGLFDVVAPPGQSARTAAVELARAIASRPPPVVGGFKRLLTEGALLDDAGYAELETRLFAELWEADAHHEAVERVLARISRR